MKYLKLFETYKDEIGQGAYHKVSEIDNDWVLKEPKNLKELEPEIAKDYFDNKEKQVLNKFRYDIKTMKENPDIFPKVKLLSKNKVAVERCDTKEAKKQFNYFYEKISKFSYYRYNLLDNLCLANQLSREILEYVKNNLLGDPICKRFYDFILLIRNRLDHPDIHEENIGIDKEGKLKLIDF